MELPWAGLHQLCARMLDDLPNIPAPLRASFGMASDGMPDPFLCWLAVQSVLTEAAEQRPLLWIVDDAYALDQASLKSLGFVSRRLHAESVGLVFAVREIPPDLAGIRDLPIQALAAADAGQLLDAAVHAPLDPAVRERVIAETGGNPLAIVELAEAGHFRQLAGGYDVPRSGRIEESFLQTAQALDPDTQTVLLLAAADPTGDAALLHRAAIATGLALPDRDDQPVHRLITFAPSVRFRHPLVRAAIYGAASDAERRAAHRALADAFMPGEDPDRRVWHLAQSLEGPDEQVAGELERSAASAQARGGWAAAAAFLSRAALITPDPATRARESSRPRRPTSKQGMPTTRWRCLRQRRLAVWTIDCALTLSSCGPRSSSISPAAVTPLHSFWRRQEHSHRSMPRWRARPISRR